MKKLWIGIGLAAAIGAALAARLVSADASEAGQVMAAEQARVTALDASDLPALERLMADDVTYIHASGKVDTKASYLAAIRSGQLHYISWIPKGLHVRMLGHEAAVIDGEYAVRVLDSRVQPVPFDITIFILTVYARREGRWQQVAWQSTRDVEASPIH
jgi:hypothetical protein